MTNDENLRLIQNAASLHIVKSLPRSLKCGLPPFPARSATLTVRGMQVPIQVPFLFTLKSGCRIEHLQLETAQRLLNALVLYSIVAWRLMGFTYAARLVPDDSCATILQPAEWKLLQRKFEAKNRSKTPPTLRQAVRWIAQLGGFLARSAD